MWFRFLSALVVFSIAGACAPKKKVYRAPYAPAPAPSPAPQGSGGKPTVRVSSDDCLTRNDQSLDPERVVIRQTIEVKREKQRVIRKDCTGKVLSDKIETITEPGKKIELRPQTLGWWTRVSNTIRATAYNRTTCSREGNIGLIDLITFWFNPTIYGDVIRSATGFPVHRIYVHTSPDWTAMHVRKNVDNYIDYEYVTCEERGGGTSCAKTKTAEKGTIVLTVKYSENLNLPGFKEVIQPCDNEPKTTPETKQP